MAEQNYVITDWNSGDAITRDKMLKIENGIKDAHSRLNEVPTNSDMNTAVQGVQSSATSAMTRANEAYVAA